MNVLCWIKARSRSFKPFVANRIGEIQSVSNPKQWHYVPTESNPADLISRGVPISQLQNDSVWWSGPLFLSLDETHWPKQQFLKQSTDEERKKSYKEINDCSHSFFVKTIENDDVECCVNPENCSRWMRLVRVQAWVNRFIQNCRLQTSDRLVGELKTDELEEAETQIIRTAQRSSFYLEYKLLKQNKPLPQNSKLLSLNPVIDEDGLLRCDGRLKYAEFLPYDVKYPVILPRNNSVTTLIVKHLRANESHLGNTRQQMN